MVVVCLQENGKNVVTTFLYSFFRHWNSSKVQKEDQPVLFLPKSEEVDEKKG